MSRQMKILVAIANYGTGNDKYLSRVLDEFRAMEYDVDLVVMTNIAKNLASDVEVVVGLPSKNPKSLPFAHKKIFADRLELYDLFVYTEDDILITGRNMKALLQASSVLRNDELLAFVRSECDAQGNIYYPDVHAHYHWDPASASGKDGYTFARFTNLHSGCYVLTREQLRRAIASGGFVVPPHEGLYEPLETAATDPFTQCGFQKLTCVSHIEDFIVQHLSNRYAGRGSLPANDFCAQLEALLSVSQNGKPRSPLFPVDTFVLHQRWSKSYYEPAQEELLSLVPADVKDVLSIGCGWGATEKVLIEKGVQVKAIPLDSVIAVNAESRGVSIIYGDLESARKQLENHRFDCLLLANVLHLVPDPVRLLSSYAELLAPQGCVIASAPNLPWLRKISRSIRFRGHIANPGKYDVSGMHSTTGRVIRRWFRDAGLKLKAISYVGADEKRWTNSFSLGLAKSLLGSNVNVVGVKARQS